MAGSFVLKLDTTGPDIEVYMPSYTTAGPYSEIVVEASEQLAEWQDFYFIDSAGDRHNVIFAYDGDRYVGSVRFNQMSLGVATLYAQVRDEVHNLSPLRTKTINVIGGAAGTTIEAQVGVRPVDASARTREIEVSVA